MKLALIPPIGYERYMLRSDMQMALAFEPAMMSVNRTTYLQKAIDRGDHIILDNGANEGAVAPAKVIKEYGWTIGAKEIVLPDSLDSRWKTVKAVESFLANEATTWTRFPKRMAVVQGHTRAAAWECVEAYADLLDITTIGIPRRLIDKTRLLATRLDLANEIETKYPGRFEIHFLGAHPMYPKEIWHAAKYSPARSMDTSLPFNWAIAGKRIDQDSKAIARSTGYFTVVQNFSLSLLDHNINVALEWARNGETTPTS